MELIKRKFKAAKGIREFKEIEIREVSGKDEITAATWVDAKRARYGESATNNLMELIRVSIVSVDGVPTNGIPFEAMDDWTSRTRNFVVRLWNSLNAVEDDEVKKAITEADPTTPKTAPASE